MGADLCADLHWCPRSDLRVDALWVLYVHTRSERHSCLRLLLHVEVTSRVTVDQRSHLLL